MDHIISSMVFAHKPFRNKIK